MVETKRSIPCSTFPSRREHNRTTKKRTPTAPHPVALTRDADPCPTATVLVSATPVAVDETACPRTLPAPRHGLSPASAVAGDTLQPRRQQSLGMNGITWDTMGVNGSLRIQHGPCPVPHRNRQTGRRSPETKKPDRGSGLAKVSGEKTSIGRALFYQRQVTSSQAAGS